MGNSGSGTFTYTVEVPDASEIPGLWAGWSAFLDLHEVKRDGTETAVPGTAAPEFTTGKPYSASLPAGFYRAERRCYDRSGAYLCGAGRGGEGSVVD
ncbi:MAG: hypothetical protein LBD55_13010 [Treponema sp.]|nr:hypothetical protein [Treponema sp.]